MPRPTDAAELFAEHEPRADEGFLYCHCGKWSVFSSGDRTWLEHVAAALLTTHPTIARVIAIGQAWVAAEEALPERWCIGIESDADIDGTDYVTFAGPNAQPRKGKHATADTPEAALQALAAALTDQERSGPTKEENA